jgi:site-specific DNA recombinase
MKIADLYIRVSTDEQADKGYSQRDQEERLRRYCQIQNIEVRKVIYEDHSAKTFNRPEWNKYLLFLRKNKNTVDLVLFIKWDRFSRNAGDAYQMISMLRKLGIEPQAVEQPLDLSVPENKMMLAFYLAAPEVENDRRALNTFHGMRRAKKEGRYLGIAPTGYINRTSEAGKKYIEPHEPQASIMKWAFETLADGCFNAEQIYKMAKEKGLKCTKSNFWMNIRNPLYCGKIVIPKYKDEEAHTVKAQHEPLVSELLFYQVQDVLDGRKRHYRPMFVANSSLPLRGFLICPKCTKKLTGSKSKGRTQDYFYYHCTGGCKCRFRAEYLNEIFVNELKKFVPRPEYLELYQLTLQEAWNDQTNHLQDDKRQISNQITDLEGRLTYLRELLSTQKIEPEDYRKMKAEYTDKIEKLLGKLTNSTQTPVDFEGLLNTGLQNLMNIERLYKNGDIVKKREIIGSMYPENLTIDGFGVRTARLNEAVSLIYSLGAGSGGQKNRTRGRKSVLSCLVTLSGFKPETF